MCFLWCNGRARIYQDDFLENYIIVYGERIDDILPRYDWRELIRWRAEWLIKNLERNRGNQEMLRLGAGARDVD